MGITLSILDQTPIYPGETATEALGAYGRAGPAGGDARLSGGSGYRSITIPSRWRVRRRRC